MRSLFSPRLTIGELRCEQIRPHAVGFIYRRASAKSQDGSRADSGQSGHARHICTSVACNSWRTVGGSMPVTSAFPRQTSFAAPSPVLRSNASGVCTKSFQFISTRQRAAQSRNFLFAACAGLALGLGMRDIGPAVRLATRGPLQTFISQARAVVRLAANASHESPSGAGDRTTNRSSPLAVYIAYQRGGRGEKAGRKERRRRIAVILVTHAGKATPSTVITLHSDSMGPIFSALPERHKQIIRPSMLAGTARGPEPAHSTGETYEFADGVLTGQRHFTENTSGSEWTVREDFFRFSL